MPLYLFGHGGHEMERIVPQGTSSVTCHCGETASRRFDLTSGQVQGKYASEFQLPRTARGLIEEASYWKGKAIKEKQEAEANGFRVAQEK